MPTFPAALSPFVERFASHAAFGPISETVIRNTYAQLIRPGDTVADVGVHYGIHLMPMADLVGPSGRVFGVEANPERFADMSRRVAKAELGQVTLLNVAASDREGEAAFFIHTEMTGRSGLAKNPRPTDADEVFDEIRVQTTTLDSILQDAGEIRFIKMDIEGAEIAALMGARRTLAQHRPFVIFEGSLVAGAAKFGLPADAPFTLARECGLSFCGMFGNDIEPGSRWEPGWNYIAYPSGEASRALVVDALQRGWELSAAG